MSKKIKSNKPNQVTTTMRGKSYYLNQQCCICYKFNHLKCIVLVIIYNNSLKDY